MMDTVATVFGAWASELTWERIPGAVGERARAIWLDTLGCLLLGADHPETLAVAGRLAARAGDGPKATAAGTASMLALQDAILVNGLATGVNVFDEGHKTARGHVAGYVLPAVLSVAESEGSSFRDALVAFVAGYEIAARIGASARINPALHPSGTWGVVGAAAAIAILRRAGREQLTATMQLAGNLTLATSWRAAIEGATVRDVYAAMPGYLGAFAADLAAAGFRGAASSIETTFGEISSPSFDTGGCVAKLGERFALEQGYVKRYPNCRNFHATLDTVLDARAALPRPFDAEGDRVTVGTDMLAFRDNRDVHAESALAARESLPVSVALALRHGSVGPQLYVDGAFADPGVLSLAKRIEIREAARPSEEARPGWTEIRMADGRTVRKEATYASGDPRNPLSLAEVREKFDANAARRLGSRSETTAGAILTGDLSRPLRELVPAWLGQARLTAVR